MKRLVAILMLTGTWGSADAQIIPTGSLVTINNGTAAPAPAPVVASIGNVRFDPAQAPLKITLHPDLTASTTVRVVSSAAQPTVTPQFYLALTRKSDFKPCRGSVATLPAAPGLEKNVSRDVPIEITGCAGGDSAGTIGILGSSADDKEIPIVLRRARSRPLTIAAYVSLLLAVIMVLAGGWVAVKHHHRLGNPIGGASWDFSTSWASNLTAFTAGFAVIAQLTIFPDKPVFATRIECFFLATFATALVSVAPAMQRFIRKTNVDATANLPVVTAYSIVGGFLSASVFTMWGAYLQMAITGLIVWELRESATLNEPISILVEIVVCTVTLALVIYCWLTMLATIATSSSRTAAPVTVTFPAFSATAPSEATARQTRISVL